MLSDLEPGKTQGGEQGEAGKATRPGSSCWKDK